MDQGRHVVRSSGQFLVRSETLLRDRGGAAEGVQGTRGGASQVSRRGEGRTGRDGCRRESVFAEMVRLGRQGWMTGTDSQLFDPLGTSAQYFSVVAGTVEPC